MAVYGAFSISTLAMKAQAHALNTIGDNIANIMTGGYKRTETKFSGVLSKSLFEQSDLGGVRAKDFRRINQQGNVITGNGVYDISINGQGFFILNTQFSGGDTFYGRDGSFSKKTLNDVSIPGIGYSNTTPVVAGFNPVTVKDAYLVDKNGYYVQGWAIDDAIGGFSSTLAAMRIDPYAFFGSGISTTNATLTLNLPTNDPAASFQTDSVTLGGTVETGDTYSVTIDNTTVTYTVLGAEGGMNGVRDALIAAINADSAAGAKVTASAGTATGNIVLTAKDLTNPLSVTSATANVAAGLADNTAAFTKLLSPYQVEKATLAGAVEAGDTYSMTIDGNTVTYTVLGTEADIDEIRDNLVTAINADTQVNGIVQAAAASGSGELTLTNKTLNMTFIATATTTNGGAGVNTAARANWFPGSTVIFNTTSIDVYDSGGTLQTVNLNFAKSATNSWQMTSTTSRTPVAQVDTITLGGTVEAGDTYSTTVNGATVTYTVTGAEAGINAVRDGLITAINANTAVSPLLTAAAGAAAGELTMTAKTAGKGFTASSAATSVTPVAQSDTITIGGAFEVGDIYTATVGANPYSYTSLGGDNNNIVATNLAALINADPAVTASAAGSVITITAAAAGTPYTLSAVGATGGVDLTQSATPFVVTANLGVSDNTTTLANTTANVTDTITSAPEYLTFDGNGQLTSTSPLTLNLSFAGAATATVTLDISSLTQFAGDFMMASYTKNGISGGVVNHYNFDSIGQVIANFGDGSSRAVYKIPIAIFSNANALEMRNGNTFAVTSESGTARVVSADGSGFATFNPGTIELSNVNVADEFARMIMTQHAYNSSATTFKTIDEMLKTVRDL